MAYTASALSFMFEGLKKPIVLTGAQLPIGIIRTDGKNNLISALEVVAEKRANGEPMIQEVAVFFDIEVEPTKIYEVGNALAKKEHITDIYHMTGNSNLHVHAMLELNREISDFLEKEIYCLEGIRKVNSRFILKRFKAREGAKF